MVQWYSPAQTAKFDNARKREVILFFKNCFEKKIGPKMKNKKKIIRLRNPSL